jgi:hypothetical protein
VPHHFRLHITCRAVLAQLGFVLPALDRMLPPLLAALAPAGRPNFLFIINVDESFAAQAAGSLS